MVLDLTRLNMTGITSHMTIVKKTILDVVSPLSLVFDEHVFLEWLCSTAPLI